MDTPLLGSHPSMIDRIKWWLFLTDQHLHVCDKHHVSGVKSPRSFHLREQNGHGMLATWRSV